MGNIPSPTRKFSTARVSYTHTPHTTHTESVVGWRPYKNVPRHRWRDHSFHGELGKPHDLNVLPPGSRVPPLPNTASIPRTYLAGKRGWREEARPLGPGVGTAGGDQCPDSLFAGVRRCMGDPSGIGPSCACPGWDRPLLVWWIAKLGEEGERNGAPSAPPPPTMEFE